MILQLWLPTCLTSAIQQIGRVRMAASDSIAGHKKTQLGNCSTPLSVKISHNPSMKNSHEIRVLRENYRAEREAAAQYRVLAERERDEKRKKVLEKLVDQEEKHAARWAARLAELGAPVQEPNPLSLAYKRFLMRNLDQDTVLRRLEADEAAAEESYDRMMQGVTDETLLRELEEVKKEEADA